MEPTWSQHLPNHIILKFGEATLHVLFPLIRLDKQGPCSTRIGSGLRGRSARPGGKGARPNGKTITATNETGWSSAAAA